MKKIKIVIDTIKNSYSNRKIKMKTLIIMQLNISLNTTMTIIITKHTDADINDGEDI